MENDRADLTVATSDASIAEALLALQAKFEVSVRPQASLGHRLNGRYSGSLRNVVSRILNGYNFVMKSEAGHLEVIVIGLTNQQVGATTRTKRRSD
jgi:hypothetical protein